MKSLDSLFSARTSQILDPLYTGIKTEEELRKEETKMTNDVHGGSNYTITNNQAVRKVQTLFFVFFVTIKMMMETAMS